MVKRGLFFISVMMLVAGCDTMQSPDSFQTANPVIERTAFIQPPINQQFQLMYGDNPALLRAFNQYVRTGSAPNIVTQGFVQFAYNNGQQPVVATSPYQETVISLQPGEQFTNVTTGDPSRWNYSAAMSGTGTNQQTNILLSPLYAGISTNMVITTDRRIYNIKLVSTSDRTYVRDIRFWYPEDMVNQINNATTSQANGVVANVPNVNLNDLNFNYGISPCCWRGPRWKPTNVFDDGKQTFIQFPASVSSGDLPVLFINNGGDQEVVNYRYKAPFFVVDRVFQQAVLLAGVGSHQQKVVITNHHYS